MVLFVSAFVIAARKLVSTVRAVVEFDGASVELTPVLTIRVSVVVTAVFVCAVGLR